MPICIECRSPVPQLYTTYSKADDRSLGKGVRLTQCPHCKRFADKYVEHDYVVLVIDLVLIKPQVYRHLLFNRLGLEGGRLDPSIIRLGILLLLFDVYLTWARIEKDAPETHSAPSVLSSHSVLTQYLFFLALCTLETLAFHLPIRFLTSVSSGYGDGGFSLSLDIPARYHPSRIFLPAQAGTPRPYPYPNRISTALLVSSCTKLFPILMVIWDYDLPSSASAVSWAVIVNNIAALEILLDCGYVRAMVLAAVGAAGRWAVGWWLLRCVGLANEGWHGFAELGAGAVGLGSLVGWVGSVT